jgi:hypothetical protein
VVVWVFVKLNQDLTATLQIPLKFCPCLDSLLALKPLLRICIFTVQKCLVCFYSFIEVHRDVFFDESFGRLASLSIQPYLFLYVAYVVAYLLVELIVFRLDIVKHLDLVDSVQDRLSSLRVLWWP